MRKGNGQDQRGRRKRKSEKSREGRRRGDYSDEEIQCVLTHKNGPE